MKLASVIQDKKIKATNVLLEMKIREYLEVAEIIISKNEFQRRRVKGSSTVYELLKEDLKSGCTIPPIVLAIRNEKMQQMLDIEKIDESQILTLFVADNLIILDGLQRTLTIIDLINELKKKEDEDTLREVLDNRVRIEIYLGLNKIGILYRMLTLNTGQTPMSLRHQIEILYSDYLDNEIKGVRLLTEIDSVTIKEIGQYSFRDVIEGFNSYLDRDELGITRSDILDNIQNLEKLSKESSTTDLFQVFIENYNNFVLAIDKLSSSWEFDKEIFGDDPVFGRNIIQVFTKSQSLSGFGAAIGKLKDKNVISGFDEVALHIPNLNFISSPEESLNNLLINLNKIKVTAKKIGVEQRMYFTYFFRELFNKESDSFLFIDKAIDSGYIRYKSLI
jgi:hypothetical protein